MAGPALQPTDRTRLLEPRRIKKVRLAGIGNGVLGLIVNPDSDADLNPFLCHFPCLPALARPNTILFKIVGASNPNLIHTPHLLWFQYGLNCLSNTQSRV